MANPGDDVPDVFGIGGLAGGRDYAPMILGQRDPVPPLSEQLAAIHDRVPVNTPEQEEALWVEFVQNPPANAELSGMERGWLPGEFRHHRLQMHDVVVKAGTVRVATDGPYKGRFVADCVSCTTLLRGRIATRPAKL